MQKYWLPWLVGMPAEVSLAICSMIFGGVFERLPSFAWPSRMAAGRFPTPSGAVEHGFEARPISAPSTIQIIRASTWARFFVDSLVHDERCFAISLELFGENSVALGIGLSVPAR